MMPFILYWAMTVHKLQGTTLGRAVVDLGRNKNAKGQAYVALSRVRQLKAASRNVQEILLDIATNIYNGKMNLHLNAPEQL